MSWCSARHLPNRMVSGYVGAIASCRPLSSSSACFDYDCDCDVFVLHRDFCCDNETTLHVACSDDDYPSDGIHPVRRRITDRRCFHVVCGDGGDPRPEADRVHCFACPAIRSPAILKRKPALFNMFVWRTTYPTTLSCCDHATRHRSPVGQSVASESPRQLGSVG